MFINLIFSIVWEIFFLEIEEKIERYDVTWILGKTKVS